MPPKIGDIVQVEGWERTKGIYVADCEVVKHEHGQVGVREVKFHYIPGGRFTTLEGDDHHTLVLPENYFDTPIGERLKQLQSEIALMLSHF